MDNKEYICNRLDDLYNEFSNDGWYEEEGLSAKGLSITSVNQAKLFADYINTLDKPNVVLYCDGTVGLEWHMNNSFVNVHFSRPDEFSYAMYCFDKDIKDGGVEVQTAEKQRQVVDKIKQMCYTL